METKKQEKEASLGEFVKVSLEGFSWAENICQRVESICAENNMVQNPVKYVDVVGEHLRKVIDTVVNDLRDHADDVLELFSELSFGHAYLVKASGIKVEELDGHCLHDKSSICMCEGTEGTGFMENSSLENDTAPAVMDNLEADFEKDTLEETFLTSGKLDRASSIKDSVLEHGDGTMVEETSNVEIEENASSEKYIRFAPEVHHVKVMNRDQLLGESRFQNRKYIPNCILLETPTCGAERLNCSAKKFSDEAALVVDLSTSISVMDVNSSRIHQSTQKCGPSPFNSIYILDMETENSSHLESDGSELAAKKGPKVTENPTKYENLNSFSMEEFGNSSIFSLKNEDLSEFEDVKLEDDFKAVKVENDWDDIVDTEIALISSLAAKKESSKIKLKKMFTSRWRPSSRSRRQEASRDDLHSKAPSEFDWELL